MEFKSNPGSLPVAALHVRIVHVRLTYLLIRPLSSSSPFPTCSLDAYHVVRLNIQGKADHLLALEMQV